MQPQYIKIALFFFTGNKPSGLKICMA